MNILIPASGLGTRVSNIANGMPKLLMPLAGTETALDMIANFWWGHNITIICRPEHKFMYPKGFCLIEETLTDGTANTIARAAQDNPHLQEDTLIQWSDIIPRVVPETKDSCIYLDYNENWPTRYGVQYNLEIKRYKCIPKSKGGVIGMYYVPHFWPKLFSTSNPPGTDFADVFSALTKKECKVLDFGTMESYHTTKELL